MTWLIRTQAEQNLRGQHVAAQHEKHLDRQRRNRLERVGKSAVIGKEMRQRQRGQAAQEVEPGDAIAVAALGMLLGHAWRRYSLAWASTKSRANSVARRAASEAGSRITKVCGCASNLCSSIEPPLARHAATKRSAMSGVTLSSPVPCSRIAGGRLAASPLSTMRCGLPSSISASDRQ